MKCNQQELAEVFGVSTRTIRRWDDAGMPSSEDRRNRTSYDTAECIQWRVERATEKVRKAAADLEDADVPPTDVSRRRREAVRAREAELDLAEREERIIDRQTFEEVVGELLTRLRRAILNLPGRWATQVLGLESPREAEARVRKLSRDLLRHLSGPFADVVEAGVPAGELPSDFPGLDALRAAGVGTLARVLEIDDLTSIDGIGPARAEAIRERLQEEGLRPPRRENGRDAD